MNFEFATAGRIVFGPGSLARLGELATPLGARALLVTGGSPDRAAPIRDALAADGIDVVTFAVRGEPTVDVAQAGVQAARDARADLVVAAGGGSAIDTGKAVAAFVTNPGDPFDHLEVVGRGQPLAAPSLPVVAVPTTAGTGAEVTRNAVLRSPRHGVKVSLRSPTMLPRVALVDPDLTLAVPPAVTAATGLDALTQAIEPFVSTRANPLTDGFCREAIARSARSLRRAFEDGHDRAAREDLALASLLAGLSLANAGLGAAHGFAAPIGGAFPTAPHGAVCGRLLPSVIATNVRALRQRDPDAVALARYDEVAQLLTGDPDAHAEDGAAWVEALVAALGISGLATYGVAERDVDALAADAARASSMQANPVRLTPAELRAILLTSL